jgi:hypothetical protein
MRPIKTLVSLFFLGVSAGCIIGPKQDDPIQTNVPASDAGGAGDDAATMGGGTDASTGDDAAKTDPEAGDISCDHDANVDANDAEAGRCNDGGPDAADAHDASDAHEDALDGVVDGARDAVGDGAEG